MVSEGKHLSFLKDASLTISSMSVSLIKHRIIYLSHTELSLTESQKALIQATPTKKSQFVLSADDKNTFVYHNGGSEQFEKADEILGSINYYATEIINFEPTLGKFVIVNFFYATEIINFEPTLGKFVIVNFAVVCRCIQKEPTLHLQYNLEKYAGASAYKMCVTE